MQDKIYHVTCSTDDKYAQHCAAMLCSLFENNQDKIFCIHLLTNILSEKNRKSLEGLCLRYTNKLLIHVVNEDPLDGVQFRAKRPLTKAAYYRLLLPSILAELDRVLYLDCDMIILGNIAPLFELDLNGYALAACSDPMPFTDIHRLQLNHPVGTKAFCSGMMMINLAYWREHHCEETFLKFARKKREPVYLHDQDVFNYTFKGQWFQLPPKWNVSPMKVRIYDEGFRTFDYIEYYQAPIIYHYCANIKPWYGCVSPKRSYYLQYLKHSGYPDIVIQKRTFTEKLIAVKEFIRVTYRNQVEPFIPIILSMLINDVIGIVNLFVLASYAITQRTVKVRQKLGFFRFNKYSNLSR